MIRDRRRARRQELSVGMRVRERQGRPMSAVLTSVSRYGCRVAGIAINPEHETAWVSLPGLEAQRTSVIWAADEAAGLAFFHPLHPAVADCLCELDGQQTADEEVEEAVQELAIRPLRQESRRNQILGGDPGTNNGTPTVAGALKLRMRSVA